VKPAPFEYVRPATVDETVAALASGADGAEIKILAGGQSLVPLLALRMARPAVLVDINRVAELSGFARCPGSAGAASVEVGALTRHRVLAEQTEHPLLAEAARWIGHPAIRSRGTAAGSLAHALGTPLTVLLCGAGCLAASLTFGARLGGLRRLVRPIYAQRGILPQAASGLQPVQDLCENAGAALPRAAVTVEKE